MQTHANLPINCFGNWLKYVIIPSKYIKYFKPIDFFKPCDIIKVTEFFIPNAALRQNGDYYEVRQSTLQTTV